jgi:hypothetical protein
MLPHQEQLEKQDHRDQLVPEMAEQRPQDQKVIPELKVRPDLRVVLKVLLDQLDHRE